MKVRLLSSPPIPKKLRGGAIIKAIDIISAEYKALSKADIVDLSCPDKFEKTGLSMPRQCEEIQVGIRVPLKRYSCNLCWDREVKKK